MAHYMNLYTACSDSIKKVESQTKVAVLEKMHQNSKDIQSFTYQFIHVKPEELHHQHQQGDKECSREWTNKSPDNEFV